MDKITKQVKAAVSYHGKIAINKYDILLGDEKLLQLIVDNYQTRQNYEQLHKDVVNILDEHLCKDYKNYETSEYVLVSNDEVEVRIDEAIVKILNQIENEFVRNELIRVGLAKKKMLRAKMFLKLQDVKNYEQAALIELFHLATLIQDDVIDEANTRRFVETINSRYDDRIAILLSDYLLVHIGYVLLQTGKKREDEVKSLAKDKTISNYYQELVKLFLNRLLASERNSLDINDLTAYRIYAEDKTARFFELALVSSVYSNETGVTIEKIEQAAKYGLEFGVIFQKIDDLLDYEADIEVSGKDSKDALNGINNYILLSLKTKKLEDIKKDLRQEIQVLQTSPLAQYFAEELGYLMWRING